MRRWSPAVPACPEGVNKGFYVRPTIFADVTNDMTIAREEIFGPVLTILGAKDEAEAVKIANDTPYGLAGYVSADTVESAAPRRPADPRRQRQPAGRAERPHRAVRRLQAVRQRPRVGQIRPSRGISRGEGGRPAGYRRVSCDRRCERTAKQSSLLAGSGLLRRFYNFQRNGKL